MTGTIVNVVGIIAGTIAGLLLNRGIPEHIKEALLRIEGVVVIVIGFTGMLESMLHVSPEGRVSAGGGMLLFFSMVLGCIAGELLRLEDRLNAFGRAIEARFGARGFARGFVSATLLFTIGAMSIVGAINDGLRGDSQVLLVKSALDGTMSIVLASTFGFGVAFAAIPVLLLQGTISLLAGQLEAVITQALLDPFCMVGYAIVTCIGINFLYKPLIKTANLLPALLVPIIYYFVHF